MDKDVYGHHLRQHLATERRKTIPAASAASASPAKAQMETTSVQF
jgi:hypothetical protein